MDRKPEDDISEAEARVSYEAAVEEIVRLERTHYEQQELCNFLSYLPTGQYIHTPTQTMWPAKSVNAKLPPMEAGKEMVKATVWLDRNTCVVQMVWIPGEAEVIQDVVVVDGGVIDYPGQAVFNTYRPPAIKPGDKMKADPWLKHVITCFPDDYEHIIGFMAHAVQRPFEKVNHALVLISREQGIGKDTIIAPVRQAVGPWNCAEVSPKALMGRFNGFAKSVILRVSEAKDLGEASRFDFYDHSKVFAAAPPEVHRCDEKHKPEQAVLNRCHMIITSNYITGGLYLPSEDRRHYVAESPCRQSDFEPGYWKELWAWFYNGGFEHVAAYLHAYDLNRFEFVKAPPPKTKAFWAVVGSNSSTEASMLADLLDTLGRPEAVTLQLVREKAAGDLAVWFMSNPAWNRVRHFLEECDYRHFPNPAAKDTFWKISGRRQSVYTRSDLAPAEQLAAKNALE